jgi:hypothetical protein
MSDTAIALATIATCFVAVLVLAPLFKNSI